MATKEPTADKDAASFSRILPDHCYLGRDREGYAHHLDRQGAVIHRVDAATGGRERRVELAARDEPVLDAVGSYLAFVADGVGWLDRRYYREPAPLAGGRWL
jgi:hypothetical protein